jgi:hypothetical protein
MRDQVTGMIYSDGTPAVTMSYDAAGWPLEIGNAVATDAGSLERVNQELKCRTRVARIFPNEASLLRLLSALLAETSDDWDSSKSYLDMNPSFPPSS